MKKIVLFLIKIILVIVLSAFLVKIPETEAASSKVRVNFIFEKKKVLKSEEFTLTIALSNYQDLASAQLFIKTDKNKIITSVEESPYTIDEANAIFKKEEIAINDKNDTIARFSVYAKNTSGYSTSSYNQLAKISFRSLGNYTDVSDFFKSESWNYGYGTKIYLYNCDMEVMDCDIKYVEEINVKWDTPSYEINYGDEIPKFQNDIKVINRNSDEYRIDNITTKEDFNIESLGTGFLKVKVFDILTNSTYYFVKSITVVDNIPPTIEYNLTEWDINDVDIENENFNYVKVFDNYDKNITAIRQYYNNNMELMASIDDFKTYLETNQKAFIIYTAVDSSGNEAIPVTVTINIIDTTPPVVNTVDAIKVKDVELDDFELEKALKLTDEYDDNPRLILKILNKKNEDVIDYKEVLKNEYTCTIQYFGKDASGNESDVKTVTITLIDTISPTIHGVTDIEITDVELLEIIEKKNNGNYLFENGIKTKDNFKNEIYLHKYYYLEDNSEMLLWEDFIKGLFEKGTGIIYYQAMDGAGNTSEKIPQRISVKDITPPVITLKNIENGKKYFGISKLEYMVTDNRSSKISVLVYLNDKEYQEEPIQNVGEYKLLIIAEDDAGNKTELSCSFSIIKDNLISCGDDIECYSRNYTEIIIASVIILSLAAVIITFNIINRIHKKKIKNKNKGKDKDADGEIIDLE